jgi:hypothetical protein
MGDRDQRIEEILAEWDLDKDGYESLNMSSISLPSTD